MVSFLLEHEHHSSRFDRSKASLNAYMERATRRSGLITLTEVANDVRDDALRGHPNFAVHQVETLHGEATSECATVYDKRLYIPVRRALVTRLTDGPVSSGFSNVYMEVSTFDTVNDLRFKCGVLHSPAHVEGTRGWRKGSIDVKAYQEMMWNLRNLMDRWNHNPYIDGWMITGDFNLDWRKLWVRKLAKQYPAKVNWYGRLPVTGGTHEGNRIIDWTIYNFMKLYKTGLLPDDASSDHRPFYDTFILGAR